MDRGHAGDYKNVLDIDHRVAAYHLKSDDTVHKDATATTRGDGYLKVWSVEHDGNAIPVSQCRRHWQRSTALSRLLPAPAPNLGTAIPHNRTSNLQSAPRDRSRAEHPPRELSNSRAFRYGFVAKHSKVART